MNERLRQSTVRIGGRIVEAMRSLERSNTQIVLVTNPDDGLAGTLTDGDLRRALLAGATLESPIAPHVRRSFIAVGQAATRNEVLELMQARTVQQIPILDPEGRVIGLHLLHEILGAVERPNWALVMAGGRGSRLWPLTEHVPKPMLMVAGRPILERIVLHLVGFGIRRIFLAVSYLTEVIERHFGDGAQFGCRIEYLREPRPLGTGGALSLLPERPADPVLVLNGDLVVQFDLAAMLAFHARGGHTMTLAVHDYTHTVPYGVVEVDRGRIVGVKEKPTVVWPTNAGIYAIEPALVERVPKETDFPMTELVAQCLSRGESVGAFAIDGDWIDVGRRQELERARGEG
jgi:dTDP-glucose pyrophosphorylase